jgi:hypothetical protein
MKLIFLSIAIWAKTCTGYIVYPYLYMEEYTVDRFISLDREAEASWSFVWETLLDFHTESYLSAKHFIEFAPEIFLFTGSLILLICSAIWRSFYTRRVIRINFSIIYTNILYMIFWSHLPYNRACFFSFLQ